MCKCCRTACQPSRLCCCLAAVAFKIAVSHTMINSHLHIFDQLNFMLLSTAGVNFSMNQDIICNAGKADSACNIWTTLPTSPQVLSLALTTCGEKPYHAGITCDKQMLMVSASLGLLALCVDVKLSLVNPPHPQYAKHSVCDSLQLGCLIW